MNKQDHNSRATIDAIPQQIWSGPADGTVDYCNQSWRAYVGFEMEDLRGSGWQSTVHPQDRGRVVKAWEESVEKGVAYEQEERHQGADGGYRWFLVRATPMRDASGSIVRWYGANIDIEDLKQAQSAQRRSQEEFRNLVNMIPAAVYTCDLSGRLTYYNKRAVELWGRDPGSTTVEKFCGSFRLYQLDGTPLGCDETLMAEAVRTGKVPPPNLEVIIERPDGSRIVVMANIAVLENERGERIGAINCFQDITERKRTESRLQTAFEEIQSLKDQLYKENLGLRAEIESGSKFDIVGTSAALSGVLARVAKVAPTDSTVLITGETGTGKELIARAIHKQSHRAARAFVGVNCASIPASLIGSELFGHEKGAFTGATHRRLGRFELAEGGTIFLDEVGELPMETQIALLRVLQEREFERVGGNQSIPADVRVIAASNRDLRAAIVAGNFRSDLFYRLNVVPIEVPALRERQDDIPMLVEYFISRYARNVGKKMRGVDKATMARLQQYPWPGNIRELQNVIERSVILCESESFSIDEVWLSRESRHSQTPNPALQTSSSEMKETIEAVLATTRGRVSGPAGAAAKLGIAPSTLESRIKTLKINKHRFKAE